MTPADIIKLTLKTAGIIGVGQTPSSEDMNDAFLVLNGMLGQWSKKRWLVYHLVDMPLACTGAPSYSVGPGGDIDMVRADRIEAAYLRQVTQSVPYQTDVPLAVIQSAEDWALVPNKLQPGFPQAVFLDTGFPLGTLHVWPVPSSLYEVHVIFKAALPGFAAITDDVELPPEYFEAIRYNLAGRLLIEYDKPQRPDIVALATAALNTLRQANVQVTELRMPANIPGSWGGGWNVLTGQWN